ASASVWQPVQPAVRKTCLPAVASPFLYLASTPAEVDVVACETVPITVSGSGWAVFSPGFEVLQPAAKTSRIANGTRRRTGASLYTALAVHGALSAHPQGRARPYN